MNYNDIKDTIRVEELEDALGINFTFRRGDEHTAHCPLPTHSGNDRNPSFGINIKKGVFNCFSCGVGGTWLDLVKLVENLDESEALEYLKEFADYREEDNVDIFIRQLEKWQHREPERIEREPELPIYDEKILEAGLGAGVSYYRNRHISDSIIREYSLGFSDCRTRGDYSGPAAIIPVHFGGSLCGFQERWIDYGKVDFPKWIPKYTNSSEFPKKSVLYNFDKARLRDDPVIVVESALTVCTLLSYGYNAVSTFSASISPRQVQILRQFPRIQIGFDNDDAGKKALRKSIRALERYTSIEVLDVPQGRDLGDLNPEEVAQIVENSTPAYLL